jgi:hypothetical protein
LVSNRIGQEGRLGYEAKAKLAYGFNVTASN